MNQETSDLFEKLTDKNLKDIALGIYSGTIFTDRNIPEKEWIGIHFMPLALGYFEDWSTDELKEVGLVYEYLDKQGPRSINGGPTFMSMRVLSINQMKTVIEYIKKIENSLDSI